MAQKCFFVFILVLLVFSTFSQVMSPGGPSFEKMPNFPPGRPPALMHGSSLNPQPMMMNMAELKNLMDEINIDKSTSSKIISIAREFLSFFEAKILKIQKEELAVKEELLKENPNLQAIRATISKKSQMFSEIEFAQIKRDLEIKSLLTQDEYDRWKSAMMHKILQMMPKIMDKGPHEKEMSVPNK